MEKNKTGKYLKYAIGEVILVVVGILIALSINNWNELRKQAGVRNIYYYQILQDLEKDKTYIHQRIKELNANILLYKNYNEKFSKHENVQSVIASQAKLNDFFGYLRFNTNTIKSLESTGDIKIMPIEIRNQLIDLKNSQEINIEITFRNNQIFLKDFMSAVNLGFSSQIADAIASGNYQLLSEFNDSSSQIALILNGAYTLKDATENNTLENLKSMLDSIDNLTKLINAELQK